MMKPNDDPTPVIDEVIAEVHRHKEAIAAEHNFDIDSLLRSLRERQDANPRLVRLITKGEQGAAEQPATAGETK